MEGTLSETRVCKRHSSVVLADSRVLATRWVGAPAVRPGRARASDSARREVWKRDLETAMTTRVLGKGFDHAERDRSLGDGSREILRGPGDAVQKTVEAVTKVGKAEGEEAVQAWVDLLAAKSESD